MILDSPNSPFFHTKNFPKLIVTKHVHDMIDVLKVPAIQSAVPSFNLLLEWKVVPPLLAPFYQREHDQLRDSLRHLLSSVVKTDQLHPLRFFLRRNDTAYSGFDRFFPEVLHPLTLQVPISGIYHTHSVVHTLGVPTPLSIKPIKLRKILYLITHNADIQIFLLL